MGNDKHAVSPKAIIKLPTVLNDLLTKLKQTDFVPTILFEKKLVEKFCHSLHDFVLNKTENETDEILEGYLLCVFLIAKKDPKFIAYISSLGDPFFSNLTSITRRAQGKTSNCELYSMVLDLIYQIIERFPFQRRAFVDLLCHVHLVEYISVDKIKDIPKCVQILDLLFEDYNTVSEVSSVSTVNHCIAVIDYIAEYQLRSKLHISVVFSCLKLLTRVCEKPSLKHHLIQSHFCQTLTKLQNDLPQHSPQIQDIECQLKSPVLKNSRTIPVLDYTVAEASRNVFLMSLSNLKQSLKNNYDITYKEKCKVYLKGQFLEKMDSQTNYCWSTPNIGEVFMDTTVEIICGMLNSNQGGRIHIGVCKNGRVVGTPITHQERDSLRSGLDQVFTCKLSPFILPRLITADFIPVVSSTGNELQSGKDRYVVHIGVPSGLNTVYYLTNKNVAFCRRGAENIELNLQEIRQLAVHLTENRYLPIVNNLKKEVQRVSSM